MSAPLTYAGGFEPPVGRTGEPSPSDLSRKSAASQARWERASHQFHVARFAATVARQWSNTGRREAVRLAMEHGILPPGPLPSAERIRLLVQKWDGGARSIDEYRDGRRRAGRRPMTLDPRIAGVVGTAVKTQRGPTPSAIRQQMIEIADAVQASEGETLVVPGVAKIARLIAAEGRAMMSAARHGAAAAEIDGLPHSTVPVDRVHEIYSLDEFTLRRWCALWDEHYPGGARYVSFKPEVVFLMDHLSRACVGYWVVDPVRRVDPQSRRPKTSGFDADDALAPILSAAFPQVATIATRPFSGFAPSVLRWDNAKAHEALRERLAAAGITVVEFPVQRPINRGLVERAIGTIKHWCDHRTRLPGREDRYVPSDRVVVDGEEVQSAAAGTKHRRATRTVIAVEDLPRIDEVRDEIETIVRFYNFKHRHRSLGGRTPLEVYRQQMPRAGSKAAKQMRPGRDLLAALPAETTRVTGEGVVHRGERFSFEIDAPGGPVWLARGTSVTYYADPMGRGLFAEVGDRVTVLPPLAHWAKGQVPAEVAKHQTSIASALEAEARTARATADAMEMGVAALARGEAAKRDALAEAKHGKAATPADPDAVAASAGSDATDGPGMSPGIDPNDDPFSADFSDVDLSGFSFDEVGPLDPPVARPSRRPKRATG